MASSAPAGECHVTAPRGVGIPRNPTASRCASSGRLRDGPGPTRRCHLTIARSPTTTDSFVWSTPIGRSEAIGAPATNAESPSPGTARRQRATPESATETTSGTTRNASPSGTRPIARRFARRTRRPAHGTRGRRGDSRSRPGPHRRSWATWRAIRPAARHRLRRIASRSGPPPPRSMMAQPITVLFMPEAAYGPTNNCIGIGNVLRERGHRVVFAAERVVGGPARGVGLRRRISSTSPRRPTADAPASKPTPASSGRTSSATPRRSSASRRSSSCDVHAADLAGVDRRRASTASRSSARSSRGQQPDVIVEDNVVGFPALVTAGAPFVRIMSCNPLEMRGPDDAAAVLRPAVGRPHRVGRVPSGVRPHPPRDVGRTSTSGSGVQGAPALADLEFIHAIERPQPVRLSAGRRLHGRAAAGRDVAAPRLVACAQTDERRSSCPPSCTDRPDGSALDLPLARVARVAPTSS